MFSINRQGLTVVGIAAVLFVSGCGGGDEPEVPATPATPPEATLTEAELVSEADAICAEVNAAIGTINSSEATSETSKEAQRGDIYLGLADRLEELGEPSDGSAPTDVITAARDLADSTGDETALASFQEAAEAYGLESCSEEPRAPSGTPSVTGDGGDSGDSVDTAPAPAPAPAPAAPAPAPAPDGGFVPGGGSSGGAGGGAGGGAPSGGIGPG